MSTAAEAAPPPEPLFRIGRCPRPLAWLPWDVVGAGRFDDPRGEFRVLYAAEQRLACFVETLAPFRPSLADLAAMQTELGVAVPHRGSVPDDWHTKRCIGRLRLLAGQRWLDLRTFATRETLRVGLAEVMLRLGVPDLDVSGARGPVRGLTQAIARWAYERDFRGLVYRSRFDDALDCWAIFEGTEFEVVGPSEPIARDDPDLRAAAGLFSLDV